MSMWLLTRDLYRRYNGDSFQAELTGFDGFLVENMIFEIHLDDTGLLICVEFEINYSLNIPLPFFSWSTKYERRLMLFDSCCSFFSPCNWKLTTKQTIMVLKSGVYFCEGTLLTVRVIDISSSFPTLCRLCARTYCRAALSHVLRHLPCGLGAGHQDHILLGPVSLSRTASWWINIAQLKSWGFHPSGPTVLFTWCAASKIWTHISKRL